MMGLVGSGKNFYGLELGMGSVGFQKNKSTSNSELNKASFAWPSTSFVDHT